MPMQMSHLFVQAQEKDEMHTDAGMDHQKDQNCFEHCMGRAAELSEHPDISIPLVVVVLEPTGQRINIVLPSFFARPKGQSPPSKQRYILKTQKRE
ncbi:hypothetical protein KJ673_02745 [Patescibacteria group bacterium]|nr:hypothetical protein [Patescibacteria group bacterium]